MISFLLTDEVKSEAYAFINRMKESGSVSIPSSPLYPLSIIKEGNMFGVLIAQTKGGERKILYGFSGALSGTYNIPGYVHTLFSEKDYQEYMKKYDGEIHRLTEEIENGEVQLKKKRRELSKKAQEEYEKIFSYYTWNGKKEHNLPPHSPTGTGECAGLKLINTALKKGWEIKGLAEFKYSSNSSELEFFAPCERRCELLLPSMLGLRYIYLDEDIAVVDKPSGFLSVPGKGEDKIDSVSYRFHSLFPSSPLVAHAHRLDMDTSGLMVLAFSKEALKNLSQQFENRKVKKTYTALLEGVLEDTEGDIDLPIRLDVENRPRQVVDFVNGKEAHTHFKRLSIEKIDGKLYTRVLFFPHTGRTHQLRVHATYGLAHPIKGDNLYGHNENGERLYLQASSISFFHPRSKKEVTFSLPPDF